MWTIRTPSLEKVLNEQVKYTHVAFYGVTPFKVSAPCSSGCEACFRHLALLLYVTDMME